MKRLSDMASLSSDEDELLGESVKVLGQRGVVDAVTTHAGRRHYHIAGNDGQRLDNVGRGDIEVVQRGQR